MVLIKRAAYYSGRPAVIVTAMFYKGLQIGFVEQSEVNVFRRGDILFFTKKEKVKRFEFIKKQKLWSTNSNLYAPLTKWWCEECLPETGAVRVYYTPIGVFIRPYAGDEFNSYQL